MNFETLKHLSERKSLGEHVFENLKQAIIRGEVVAGTRLVESRIADVLDISRTPVREAIHKLEREGLIEKLPRGGFSVLGLTREEIGETFGIRSVLESYAASLSALNYQDGELLPLEEKISEYEMYLQKKTIGNPSENQYGISRSALYPESESKIKPDDQSSQGSDLPVQADLVKR